MDASKVLGLLEQLDGEIDDLEESLAPLITTALSDTASKLPLLDKAKLYVLVTYAIESILFSYLRLHGVKARDHPVFTELTRVKQYFEKIKRAENPVGKRENMSVDKDAATRIIRAGLSGNDKYDLERAEREAKERAKAHIKFEQISERIKQSQIAKKRKATDKSTTSDSDSSSESDSDSDTNSDSDPKPPLKEKFSLPTPESHSKPPKIEAPKQAITTAKPGTPTFSDQPSSGNSNKKNNKKNKKKRRKQDMKT